MQVKYDLHGLTMEFSWEARSASWDAEGYRVRNNERRRGMTKRQYATAWSENGLQQYLHVLCWKG